MSQVVLQPKLIRIAGIETFQGMNTPSGRKGYV